MITTQIYSQSAYNILIQPSTARNIALSGGGISTPTSSPNSNIATIEVNNLLFGTGIIFYPAEIVGNSTYFFKKTKTGIIGCELFSINYGTMEDGETHQTFTAKDILLKVHYKTKIWNSLSVGMSINYLKSNIENYTSNVVSADFGLRTSVLERRLMMSVSAQNLGRVIKSYGQTIEQLPERYILGLSYKPIHFPGILSLDFQQYKGDDQRFIGAIEFNPNGKFQLRISTGDHRWGLTTGSFWDDVFTGIAFGAGFTVSSTTIDIGFQNFGSAGFVNVLSIKYSIK